MPGKKRLSVASPIGEVELDTAGATVGVVKMDATKAYSGIPALLKEYINNRDAQAWEQIKTKVDYIYNNMDYALGALEKETGLGDKIRPRMRKGQKLFFKPNLVSQTAIDPVTHGEGGSNSSLTEWPTIAALMRWFHDKLGVSYNEMAVGEAATTLASTAILFGTQFNGNKPFTTESIIEGKRGDFCGGWGFYFVRKYLADNHPKLHKDNPMNGYEESVSGTYLPPGKTGNRMMVYDLNRVCDGRGRDIPVPKGINYKTVTMHKVLVGGDPADPKDIKNYPGCVLVNVPRMKTHPQEFLTCALKNIGIGLYPMEATIDGEPDSTKWKYSVPHSYPPSQKARLSHEVWDAEVDEKNKIPIKDAKGNYILTRTGGLVGTITDAISSVQNQNTLMVHVVDAIEALAGGWGPDNRTPEGLVLASLDPVALDLLCYRYAFKLVPMKEARKVQREQNLKMDFIQKVPLPVVDGPNIVTGEGYDTPIARTYLFTSAESRGLGQQKYHVAGWDVVAGSPLASLEGHLGRVEDGKFTEVITTQLYYSVGTPLWSLQATAFGYLKAHDRLTGSTYMKQVLDALDEDGDGVIGIHDTGRKGFYPAFNRWLGDGSFLRTTEKYGGIHGGFLGGARFLRYSNTEWNAQGHDFTREYRLSALIAMALRMSKAPVEQKDPFFPGMTWGKGKWPSIPYVQSVAILNTVFGPAAPDSISLMSAFGFAFQYADKTLNNGGYTGGTGPSSDPEALNKYLKTVSDGAAPPLDFMVYVPKGFGLNGKRVPNLEETTDPAKVFTASFNHNKEVW